MTKENTEENGKTGDKIAINKETVEELQSIRTEDPILTEYGTQGDNEENPQVKLAENWMPDSDSWQGKTRITASQAHALSLARSMTEVYPEIEELGPFLMKTIVNYEQYLTSIDGLSREQQVDVLRSMFGDSAKVGEENRSMIMGMLNGAAGDDDE